MVLLGKMVRRWTQKTRPCRCRRPGNFRLKIWATFSCSLGKRCLLFAPDVTCYCCSCRLELGTQEAAIVLVDKRQVGTKTILRPSVSVSYSSLVASAGGKAKVQQVSKLSLLEKKVERANKRFPADLISCIHHPHAAPASAGLSVRR